jgi:hypothetical protein
LLGAGIHGLLFTGSEEIDPQASAVAAAGPPVGTA